MSGEPHGRGTAADDRAPPVAATAPATDVRDDDRPRRCPYCDRPFRRERYEALHRGREHLSSLSDRERAAFERAVREEETGIRRVRLYAIGVLVLLYFGLLIVAAFVV